MSQETRLACPLRRQAEAGAARPALVDAGGTLAYGALDRMVTATAAHLHRLGEGRPLRVGCYLPNGRPLVTLLLAAMRAGGVACPLSTRVPPAALAPLLQRAGIDLLVTETPAIAEAATVPAVSVPVYAPADLIREDAAEAAGPPAYMTGQPATLVFTSGSTGTPKAALHTFGNHYYNALGSNRNLPLGEGDRWLLSLPLYHVGGLAILFRCLLAGATVVLPAHGMPPADALVRAGITHVSMVATQLLRLLQAEAEPAGLKAVLLGGSALPPSLVDEAVRRGLPVYTSYGLTEMASQVCTTPPAATAAQLRSSGRCLPYRALAVSADGEILVRGATLFAGYVEGTAVHRPLDADGWFHTGDLGRLDADGFLHVQGRKDNLFISGGENIQPEEIEEALGRLPGVAQAVVVPVADAEYGQRPVAYVRTTAAAPALAALADHLAPLLPRFKIPVAFHPWPRDVAEGMKVDRRALQARAAGAADRP